MNQRRTSYVLKTGAIFVLILMLLFLPSSSAAQLPVHDAIRYAREHWDWSKYDESNNRVSQFTYQSDFQCAEFVARSLIAVGSIGDLNSASTQRQLGSAIYNDKPYNLLAVRGLYKFLVDTGIGRDMKAEQSNITLGSVIVYGDFNHVTLVTTKELTAEAKITGHNQAMLDYPVDGFYYKEGAKMPITHILGSGSKYMIMGNRQVVFNDKPTCHKMMHIRDFRKG